MPTEPMNILLITTDQQHGRMLSCAGEKYARTPALDALAAGGRRFELAYAPNPVYVPCRYRWISGMMPTVFGGMEGNPPSAHPAIREHIDTPMLGHSFYEESARVPFLVTGPGLRAGVVDTTRPVHTGPDLIPTLCDFAGIEVHANLQSRSLRGFADFERADDLYATAEEALFDPRTDPGEMNNLADDPTFDGVLREHRTMPAGWAHVHRDHKADNYLNI